MKKLPLHGSKRWLTGAAAGLAAFTGGERLAGAPWVDLSDLSIQRAATLDRFASGYEGVLGTSLDVIIEAARPADAAACEARILGEIERLRRILSTYDSASEISRVMAGAPVASAELAEVLAVYADWTTRTNGLVDLNLGGVIDVWRAAARSGRMPDEATLAEAAQRSRAYNLDALGKGFIIDRAVAVARRSAPGGLLNLGGDIRAWGETAWPIAIADPRNPADNAPPIARFALREAAVATSGGYARFFDVGGKRFSHLIDPRTRRPLAPGGSATIVASDAVTANALSAAASVGGPATGARLARAHGAAGYFFAAAAGEVSSGGVLAPAAATPPPATPDAAAKEKPAQAPATEAPWPADFQVSAQVTLKKHAGGREIFRPYVVVWVQNARGEVVRTVTVWGTDERWQRKLSAWWNQPGLGGTEPPLTTRATRPAGSYTVTWSGTDDSGRRLPAGNYTLCLEISRENGHHILERVNLTCGQEPVTAGFRETVESEASTITYGPVKPREG